MLFVRDMMIRQLFDRESSSYTYLLADLGTGDAALVDPVRDQVERDLRLVDELDLTLRYVFETHVHADHVTAAARIRDRVGALTIGPAGGADCVDEVVGQGDRIPLGGLEVEVLETPGHTAESLSYRVGDDVFTGDTLLIRGCGRTDFQGGDPRALWRSITEVLFALPNHTRVWPGHDYRGLSVTTIGEEKRHNPRLAGKSVDDFVAIMDGLGLAKPKLIDVAVPANRACGEPSPAAPDNEPA